MVKLGGCDVGGQQFGNVSASRDVSVLSTVTGKKAQPYKTTRIAHALDREDGGLYTWNRG